MDGSAAIEWNRLALLRIVASLMAMAGFAGGVAPTSPLRGGRRSADRRVGVVAGSHPSPDASRRPSHPGPAERGEVETAPTLPRYLWVAILRLLRPAEAAARRLIIASARGIVLQPRTRPTPDPSARLEGRRGSVSAGPTSPFRGGRREASGGGIRDKLTLPLFDPLRRVAPRRIAPRDLPRICVPGWTARLPVPVRLVLSSDDVISATRLAMRFDALARALDDLPGQARRFARWQARAAAGAQETNATAASSPPPFAGEVVGSADRNEGRSLRPMAEPDRRRFRRLSPLRGGPPPGCRLARYDPAHREGREIREIDEILAHAHDLAIDALEHPDTS